MLRRKKTGSTLTNKNLRAAQATFVQQKKSASKSKVVLDSKEILSGDLKDHVKLPPDYKKEVWVVQNLEEFYNRISILFQPLQNHCTPETCPVMGAGPGFTFKWKDDDDEEARELPAYEYIQKLSTWIESSLSNPYYFPEHGEFPAEFWPLVKKMFQRLARVFSHMYHSHLPAVTDLSLEKHLNTLFTHFFYFTREFDLVGSDEFGPLKTVIRDLGMK